MIVMNKTMTENSKYIKVINEFLLILGAIFSIFIIISPENADVKTVMKIYGGLSMLLLIYTFFEKNITTLGCAHIFILYILVSSFGYDLLVLFGGDLFFDTISSIRHAYLDYFNKANALCYIGVAVLVYGISSIQKSNISDPITLKKRLSFDSLERRLYLQLCLAIISLYSFILLMSVVTGRLPLTNYADVKDWFSTQPFLSYLLRLAWVAIPTYIYFAESKQEYISFFIPLGIMFLILMITGNRNEILYPAAVAVGISIWKRCYFQGKTKLPKLIIVGILIVVFVLNPLISSTRQSGLSISNLITGSFGVSDVLLELGQQLNPFSIILYALDQEITSFKYGMTLIVPTVSILSLNLMWGTSIFNDSIEYNPTVVLNHLGHYGRGFSCIAEFYYNFGMIGMIVCLFIIGRYMGKRENATFSKRKILFYFQIMPLLMVFSRNILGYNVLIIIFALALNLLVQFIAQTRNR